MITPLVIGKYDGATFQGIFSSKPNYNGIIQANVLINVSAVIIQGNASDPSACVVGDNPNASGTVFKLGSTLSEGYCVQNLTLDMSTFYSYGFFAGIEVFGCYFVGDESNANFLRIICPPSGEGHDLSVFNLCQGAWVDVAGDVNIVSGEMNSLIFSGHRVIFFSDWGTITYGAGITQVGPFIRAFGSSNLFNSLPISGSVSGGTKFKVDGPDGSIDIRGLSGSSRNTLPGAAPGTVTGGATFLSATETIRDFSGLPISASGLAAGTLWNNAGVLTVV